MMYTKRGGKPAYEFGRALTLVRCNLNRDKHLYTILTIVIILGYEAVTVQSLIKREWSVGARNDKDNEREDEGCVARRRR